MTKIFKSDEYGTNTPVPAKHACKLYKVRYYGGRPFFVSYMVKCGGKFAGYLQVSNDGLRLQQLKNPVRLGRTGK